MDFFIINRVIVNKLTANQIFVLSYFTRYVFKDNQFFLSEGFPQDLNIKTGSYVQASLIIVVKKLNISC